ncbi:MAG: LPS export ABC transporter ATP-binding protein [bacterium]|nr:LPS export ABC transporter ATP-binding protein [bacterium]
MAIRTQGLVKIYKDRRVVNGVDLEVKPGEVVGLLGSNGAGKTTTFYMVMGLIRPNAGKIFLNDQEVTNLPMHVRARLGIGYLPQEASAFRKLTVEDNLRLLWQVNGVPKKEQAERLERLLDEYQLHKVRRSKAVELSGGERRRLEIARSLAIKPQFLLLDEPFSGVDPIAVASIQKIVRSVKAQGLGILITDHNVRETLAITDRAYIIREGKILVSGSAVEVANDPLARKYYLGESYNTGFENSQTTVEIQRAQGQEVSESLRVAEPKQPTNIDPKQAENGEI